MERDTKREIRLRGDRDRKRLSFVNALLVQLREKERERKTEMERDIKREIRQRGERARDRERLSFVNSLLVQLREKEERERERQRWREISRERLD